MDVHEESKVPKVVTRSSINSFNWTENCLFCGDMCVADERNPSRKNWHQVESISYRNNLERKCSKRKDRFAEDVQRRILDTDLIAKKARYHVSCYDNFYQGYEVNRRSENSSTSTSTSTSTSNRGRPIDTNSSGHFERVCSWLESEAEVYSLSEIHEKMIEMTGSGDESDNVYTQKWLKVKLKQRYGEHIVFSEDEGRSLLVYFHDVANYLINDKWYKNRKSDANDEAERIISTAAKLILDDMRSKDFSSEFYPMREEIASCDEGKLWVPPYLRLFMEKIIKNPLKQASLGQAIVSAARPRSCIAPILFGLGVDCDHVLGSKWLLTIQSRLGYSVGVSTIVFLPAE